MKNNLNLFLEIYQNQKLPECYLAVNCKGEIILNNSKLSNKPSALIFSHFLSPSYLDYSFDKKRYQLNKIKQINKGYVIDLYDFLDVKEYMRFQMKRSSRKTIYQSIRGLENMFDISYKTFDSNLSKEKYDELFAILRTMLDERFNEKAVTDEKRKNWTQIKEHFYEFLKKDKAAIFVIYDSLKPIGISLKYLSNNLVFSYISSYDSNYSKFGMGHIDIYKIIEWCFDNDYKLIELGYGDHAYKNRWCNNIYNFEHHILYNKKSILGNILGQIEYCKIIFKEYLKGKLLKKN